MSFRRRSSVERALGAIAVLVAGLVLAACDEVPSTQVKSEPFKLVSLKGTDIKLVKLDDRIARNIDLQTAVVRGNARQKTVPHKALIYNPEGKVFVYTRPKPETYLRAPVAVKRVVGDHAVLSRGPRPGTIVVTVGAAELLATEYEILNQHP